MNTSPNILVICTDQHRYDAVSTDGAGPAITPNLAALARDGASFDHCFSSNTICAPTRASLLTGLYPRQHGLWANGVTLPQYGDLVTAELARNGYRCGLVGKLHLSAAYLGKTETRGDDGFQVFEWAHDPSHGSPENAYHAWLRAKHPAHWKRAETERVTQQNTEYKHGATAFDSMLAEAHYTTWVAERAAAFLESTDDRPFFLLANFFDPHHPFAAPQEYLDLYPPGSIPPPKGLTEDFARKPDWQQEASHASYSGNGPSFTDFTPEEIDGIRRCYYAMVTMVDDAVATILKTLQEQDKESNTLVIFTSDHGEMLGDHRLLLKGPMMYEAAVRVPLILRWPDHIPADTAVHGMVGTHDIGRTIRASTGLPKSEREHGLDLASVSRGETQARTWAVCEYRDSCIPGDRPIHTTMLRTPNHKLVMDHGDPAEPRLGELYDLDTDPDELQNLYGLPEHLGTQLEMMTQLVNIDSMLENRSAPREAPW